MTEMGTPPVTDQKPLKVNESLIRRTWTSVQAIPAVASLGRKLIESYVGAPLGFLVMAPFYFKKILPGIALRYTLTNQNLMIERGLLPVAEKTVPLSEIEEVRIVRDENSAFFRSATLEIVGKGEVKLTLPGVPEPEGFRQAILNACMAWVPGRAAAWMPFVPGKKEEAKK
jgi:hypothetical protein